MIAYIGICRIYFVPDTTLENTAPHWDHDDAKLWENVWNIYALILLAPIFWAMYAIYAMWNRIKVNRYWDDYIFFE